MIIYQVYPRSFFDSNSDGIGDLPGIVKKIPYIADLGVDTVWISPFFTSPMRDFGYDISDYRGVAPIFGNITDFDRVVKEAHRYHLTVMIDQVWGHSSDLHPWFQESRSSRTNAKAEWYVWADPKPDGYYPNNWLSIFGGPAWSWSASRQQYFLHHFLSTQPAFNFHNPEVFDALMADAWFWIERGVDGIRIDAIPHYIADKDLRSNPPLKAGDESTTFTAASNPRNLQENIYTECNPQLLEWIERCRAFFRNKGKDVTLLGEVMTGGIEFAGKCVEGDNRLQTAYTGELLGGDLNPQRIKRILKSVHSCFDSSAKMCWSLGNHDVRRFFSRLKDGSKDAEKRWRLIVAWYLSLEGHLCWYQGDELGLTEADIPLELIQDPFGKAFWPEFKGRDGCRTPFPWSKESRNGGFSKGPRPWLPLSAENLARAVDRQGSKNSKLSYFKSFLKLRTTLNALRTGTLEICAGVPDEIVGFYRTAADQKLLCLFNFSEESTITLNFNFGLKNIIRGSAKRGAKNIVIGPSEYLIAEV